MTKVEEEKDQPRRADKVIKHRAALGSAPGSSRLCVVTQLSRSLSERSGH